MAAREVPKRVHPAEPIVLRKSLRFVPIDGSPFLGDNPKLPLIHQTMPDISIVTLRNITEKNLNFNIFLGSLQKKNPSCAFLLHKEGIVDRVSLYEWNGHFRRMLGLSLSSTSGEELLDNVKISL